VVKTKTTQSAAGAWESRKVSSETTANDAQLTLNRPRLRHGPYGRAFIHAAAVAIVSSLEAVEAFGHYAAETRWRRTGRCRETDPHH